MNVRKKEFVKSEQKQGDGGMPQRGAVAWGAHQDPSVAQADGGLFSLRQTTWGRNKSMGLVDV